MIVMPIEPALPSQILSGKQNEQVLRFWPILTQQERQALLNQIQRIDWGTLHQQKEILNNKEPPSLDIEPFTDLAFAGSRPDFLKGKQLIREGRMGCLLLAGGQGMRLRIDGPKGRFPVSIIKKKSLFQLAAEKTLAAGKQAGAPLALAIMTSPENDEATRRYFSEHAFFGLQPDQLSFFCQGTLPLLDAQGHLFLESRNRLAEGPNGNGSCFHDFFKSGIWQAWSQRGIEYVNVVLIDNPLADPFDAELLGFHTRRSVDITVKCTEKRKPHEKVGVVVKKNNRFSIIEYTELPENEKKALLPDGRLKHCCANLSLFCFSMDFIEKIAVNPDPLPLHKAWKAAKFVNEEGVTQLSATPIAWKFETFIFDLLSRTDRVAALLYPREQCFAPLKNYTGEDSLETVQEAIQKREKAILKSITGLNSPLAPFELAADFYYPTPELLEKWKKREPRTSYIEP